MKICLIVEYDGCGFCGWQRQCFQVSVQETLEEAIESVFAYKEKIEIFGAGRTDAGVHALAQVAHFEIFDDSLVERWRINCGNLPKAINSHMKGAKVVVKSAEVVPDDFHSRFSAKLRNYKYIIYNNPIDSVLYHNRVWHVRKKLDVDMMNIASQDIVGRHDFQSFRSSQCSAASSIKSVFSINVCKEGNFVVTNISAKSFLHNQVRIIVGTLREIGCGRVPGSYMKFLLSAKDRKLSGQTAPPWGLYLESVRY